MRQLRVHFLPELVTADVLAGGDCVVIDVLRATTTVVFALAAGAREVIPCLTIEEARQRASSFSPGEVVLGGERGGLPIEGFDLGNSPAEYTPEAVVGKTVVLTTTNGTKALAHCRHARTIRVAAFVNLSAACMALAASDSGTVDLVCAGTDGKVTGEDVLLSGALARRLSLRWTGAWQENDQARIAQEVWSRFADRPHQLADELRMSHGGRNLIEIGLEGDIELASEIDRFSIVPRFDPATGRIVADPTPTPRRP